MEEKTMQEEQNLNEMNDTADTAADIRTEPTAATNEQNESAELTKMKKEIHELKDKYLRQVAEFDNFRKRTARERIELSAMAGKEVISALLPVLDDIDRAEKQLDSPAMQELSALREGIRLIFAKFRSTLTAKGLKAMESVGQEFSPEFHEAITEVPVPADDLKGKVVDEVEKGYYLNDKIIRFAKVVVGK